MTFSLGTNVYFCVTKLTYAKKPPYQHARAAAASAIAWNVTAITVPSAASP